MSLSPSLPSLSTLTSSLKHGEEAAPFSDYSPPSPLPTVGYRFPSPAIPESPSQVIYSTSKDSGKAAETKYKATTTKKVRIDLPIDHCSSTNGSMLDLSVDHPSGPSDVEAEIYLDLSPDGTSSPGLHSLAEGGSPVDGHGQSFESSDAVVSPASQAIDGEAGAGKGEDPEAGPGGVDVPEAGVTVVVDRCGSPIPRSESAMSGVYRSEKRQGWSGEWNQPHILDVIEKLRNL
ncbi:hypothetical protein BKA70DRAFT_1522009 [Coprinopsis sp. MPI-PUGE-AT-0042]|nr:hypothetical protein BKA70DRAFT_1522009 [Coprinopsis sp. MPI-PUGE-AT-0042]